MSLILDALRRAETQRQTQIQPVYSLPSGHRTRSEANPLSPSVVIAGAAGAVLIAAIAVTWMAMRGTSGASDAGFPAPAPRVTAPAQGSAAPEQRRPAATARTATPREMGSLSAMARADDPIVTGPATVATAPGAVASGGNVQVVEPAYTAAVSNTPAAATSARDVAPGTVVVRDLLAEEGITAGGGSITVATPAAPTPSPVQAAPATATNPARAAANVANLAAAPTEFTLNMLSTSTDPASSYVYINMRRYGIGDQTPEGAVVDDISNAGAVIRYRGQRYLLKSR